MLQRHNWLIGVLGLAVILSSLAVVYATHTSRELFAELQDVQEIRDQLDVEWGQLLLEQSAWSNNNRIESVARDKLHMIVPPPGKIIVVRP